jgi:ribokinase
MANSTPQAAIATFGSVNVDVCGFCTRLPKPGETAPGQRYTIALGGKGANQAAAVARLGGQSQMIGRAGNDMFGAMIRDRLDALAVGRDHLIFADNASTGIALISVDAHGENCIVVIGGANMIVDQALVDHSAATLRLAPVLLTQLEVPLAPVLAAAALTRAGGGLVILDPAPAPSDGLSSDVLRGVDIVTPNETETETLVGIRPQTTSDAEKAARLLAARGAPIVIIKMGSRGAYFHSRNIQGFVPPFAVKAVNSVGAGDCFNGALAVALARGDELPRAVRFAAACGALATLGPGGAGSAPTLAAVEDLLQIQPS